MYELAISIRDKIFHFLYIHILKRIYFTIDPEVIHDRMVKLGHLLGKNALTKKLVAFCFSYRNPALDQTILGIHFPNPVGLAAGFDKNAQLTQILPQVGFGHAEVGSITGKPCKGNPKPRLWRLKKSKSLLVYYGLMNDGSDAIASRLKDLKFEIPIGTSVAKTNSPDTVETEKGIADYVKAYKAFTNIGSYSTINISCPNAYGGEPFTDPVKLEALLTEIDKIPSSKPIFLKISPDLGTKELDEILNICQHHKISGFICSNLTKDRSNPRIKDDNVPDKGGMSGKVSAHLADDQISYIYKKTSGRYIIIGCGGVFTAEDAYKKIKAGASLLQMITGMIYEGPQVISEINQGLVQLLKQDGFDNISEAIGQNHK